VAFLSRVRFIERNIGLPVKLVLLVVLGNFLFFTRWFYDLTPPREDALEMVRTFFLIYTALSVGAGIFLWGMSDVSPRFLERVVYSMAILDGALLAMLTFVTGGFESILYWLFLGLIIRNSAIIPHADVQIAVSLIVTACYVVAGGLDIALIAAEQEITGTIGRGGVGDLSPEPSAEPLVLRVLLLLLMMACCYGIQVLFDRQRRAEIEAREFAVKQEQLQAAGRLAAEIAHQLKNPLGIINTAAYTLQKTVKEGKTITQQIAIIREEVHRSDQIITELMGYAKLAEGKVERVSVIDELEQALTTALPAAARFEIRVHRDYAHGVPLLLAQRGHISEIFVNLLTNAREAMGGKGEIFVGAHAGPDFTANVSIRDTGPGISAETLAKLFEPYFTTKERGTGLGLAIVKHNTELYGGSVKVESVLGKGATFTVLLPARTAMRVRR
jgi:signal transduction histidine kinase